MSRKLNLNMFFISRFYTVILTQYLWFSSSDLLHSSFCLIYFREVTSKSLFRTKEIQFSCHCFKSHGFETVHYHHAQCIPPLPDATTIWLSCFSEHHFLLLTMTTPERCSQDNSTRMFGALTMCQAVCYLLEIHGHAIKNKQGTYTLTLWSPLYLLQASSLGIRQSFKIPYPYHLSIPPTLASIRQFL